MELTAVSLLALAIMIAIKFLAVKAMAGKSFNASELFVDKLNNDDDRKSYDCGPRSALDSLTPAEKLYHLPTFSDFHSTMACYL
jgi:hypothetical protein